MGRKSREIVDKPEEVLQDLQKAYADEWLAHYYYMLAANIAIGMNAPIVAQKFRQNANEELEHANQIAERILELGGELPRRFEELPSLATYSRYSLPEDPRDLQGIIRELLESERAAITFYNNLAKKTQHGDFVTFELAEDILSGEVADEEELENLLGE